jgi:hypothetical protein
MEHKVGRNSKGEAVLLLKIPEDDRKTRVRYNESTGEMTFTKINYRTVGKISRRKIKTGVK